MPTIEILSRSHFREVPQATAAPIADNAWEVDVPLDAPALRKLRIGRRLEDWDGVVFAIDGAETAPAVATGIDAHTVTVTVWLLPD